MLVGVWQLVESLNPNSLPSLTANLVNAGAAATANIVTRRERPAATRVWVTCSVHTGCMHGGGEQCGAEQRGTGGLLFP